MDKSCVEFRLKKFAIEAFRLEFRFGIEMNISREKVRLNRSKD